MSATPTAPAPDPTPSPEKPLEGVKLAVDFVKQILTISSQLITVVSGGIYFLRAQHFTISNVWIAALVLLIASVLAGMLSFGAYIRQIDLNKLSTTRGSARLLSLAQTLLFLGAIGCVIWGGAISAPLLNSN